LILLKAPQNKTPLSPPKQTKNVTDLQRQKARFVPEADVEVVTLKYSEKGLYLSFEYSAGNELIIVGQSSTGEAEIKESRCCYTLKLYGASSSPSFHPPHINHNVKERVSK